MVLAMGSTSWHDDIVKDLLIALGVQIIASILCVLCASIWAFLKEWMDRPGTGESISEADLEMGRVNVGDAAAILGVGDLEYTEDMAKRPNNPDSQIPAADHPPNTQCKTVTEDERRASVPVVASLNLQIPVAIPNHCGTSKAPVEQGGDTVVADPAPVQLLVTEIKGVTPH